MENQQKQNVVKTSEWVLTLLVAAIPLVGFVMLLVWAFSGSTNPNKSNWAKAALIWISVILVTYALVAVVFGAALLSSIGEAYGSTNYPGKDNSMEVIESAEDSNSQGLHSSKLVTCQESETYNEVSGDPVLTRICFFDKYKSETVSYADYAGRYDTDYQMFVRQANGNYAPINNSSMFNQNKDELLFMINSQIKEDIEAFSMGANDDCFEEIVFSPFAFDDLGISFDEASIQFNADFGISNACRAVGGTTVSIGIREMEKYLN